MAIETVTSENRQEYMNKKMGRNKPHGIWHSSTDRLHSHHPTYDKANAVYEGLKNKDKFSIAELSAKQKKELGYE